MKEEVKEEVKEEENEEKREGGIKGQKQTYLNDLGAKIKD